MPAKIILSITDGQRKGQAFEFTDRNSCIMGRAEDCEPTNLPDDQDHKTISRHHCLLDINPPDIRVRDFGSRNGTYVNDQKIGQREEGMTPEQGAELQFPEYELKDGDKIKLGNTVLRVGIFVPAMCAECEVEIPDSEKAQRERTPGVYQCSACRKKADAAKRVEPPKPKVKRCAKCGKDASLDIGNNRHGEFICAHCKADPFEILKLLLSLAKSGDKGLVAIQGYSILKELGKGGMGAVYLARHDQSKKQVALKVMLPQVAADELAKRRFLDETENTKALNHPNVVRLQDYGCSQGTFFFTLEYCDGGSVDKLMKDQGGVLSIADAGKITLQALDGLEYAHNAVIPNVKLADGNQAQARGLVHRDLKPHNLFLSGAGSSRIAKVGDFGLAKAFDKAGLSGRTRTGSKAGTPYFMPRQQVINFKYSKPEIDVWAMAASLYYMLTGVGPRDFRKGKDPWQLVLDTSPVPIRQRNSAIPEKLAKVIDAALVDKPAITFKTAAALKKAMEEVL